MGNSAAQSKKWRGQNPERTRQLRSDYYKANKEHLKQKAKERYARNKERFVEYATQRFVEKKYGVTPEQYAALVAACGGRCEVCRRVPTGRFAKLCVDHNHETDQVRGMLCHGCNTSLGMLKEDPLRIRALAAYAEKFDWLNQPKARTTNGP